MILQTLIDCLVFDSNVQICIHDISGILSQPKLKLFPRYTVHNKPFCMFAKSSVKGHALCVINKSNTIKKSIETDKPFVNRCHFGVIEIVRPVLIDEKVAAIIYIGNITDDINKLYDIVTRVSHEAGHSNDMISMYLQDFCVTDNLEPYEKIAEIICCMITMLYDKNIKHENGDVHWVVDAIVNYIGIHYNTEISLRQLSNMYYFTENYLGRLFKKQTGLTISKYLTDIRLKKAVELLIHTDYTITEISSLAGFNNITYFDRQFKKKTDVSPVTYRKSNK